MLNKLPDNFFAGMLGGIITLVCSFFILRTARLALAAHFGNPYFFPQPRVELIVILINIIFFRVMIVNLKKEKTGRGILFITVLLAILFFFLFFIFNYRLL